MTVRGPEFTGRFHPPASRIYPLAPARTENQYSAARARIDAKEKVVILT
jgi:hypothetical protein